MIFKKHLRAPLPRSQTAECGLKEVTVNLIDKQNIFMFQRCRIVSF